MKNVLFYCRPGFEADLATEVQTRATELAIYGYPVFSNRSGFIVFNGYQHDDGARLIQLLDFNQLIFARQMIACADPITDLNTADRVSGLLEASESIPFCGELRVEYPDTSEGRELTKFCRKLSVPLRQALRKVQRLSNKQLASQPVMHVFFPDGKTAYLGVSYPGNNSPQPLGIMRLKFPSAAPSRSTLKLDEAFQTFIAPKEQDSRLRAGLHAVDLGACPGGWTYQLVTRGMFVQAVDNGKMDERLMETGQVTYFAADGFKYEPRKKNVYWLVCDMIEQPQRVARLMAKWLAMGWCQEAIFNLKLPMKRRFESVTDAFAVIDDVLHKHGIAYNMQAKHLYHDREEITVHLQAAGQIPHRGQRG